MKSKPVLILIRCYRISFASISANMLFMLAWSTPIIKKVRLNNILGTAFPTATICSITVSFRCGRPVTAPTVLWSGKHFEYFVCILLPCGHMADMQNHWPELPSGKPPGTVPPLPQMRSSSLLCCPSGRSCAALLLPALTNNGIDIYYATQF